VNHLYFAYGSNMNPERIRQRIPEARALGRAVLKGWKVTERFYADIDRARGGRVEGVLYCVSETELRRLDAYEGYPRVYDCIPVSVYADLLGVGKPLYRVPAFTYVMTDETKKEREGKKYPDDYRIVCAVGAKFWGLKRNAFGAIPPSKPRQTLFSFSRMR
jgi:gamma-glutamylcyclotransferase (GGCT)/AIG2-like uncharacterized protein YtfP